MHWGIRMVVFMRHTHRTFEYMVFCIYLPSMYHLLLLLLGSGCHRPFATTGVEGKKRFFVPRFAIQNKRFYTHKYCIALFIFFFLLSVTYIAPHHLLFLLPVSVSLSFYPTAFHSANPHPVTYVSSPSYAPLSIYPHIYCSYFCFILAIPVLRVTKKTLQ